MKNWQDRGSPYQGFRYTALTHHRYWDGRMHYWTGMPVRGSEDQDPENPNCCQDTDIYEGGEVQLSRPALATLRSGLRSSGHTHRIAGERVNMGLSRVRQRLYGRRPFTRNDVKVLCGLAGIEPESLHSCDGSKSN